MSRSATASMVAVVVFAMSPLARCLADPSEQKHIRWLFNGPGVVAMAADPEASRLLDNRQPYVMWGRELRGVPESWNSIPAISFKSFSAIENALESGVNSSKCKRGNVRLRKVALHAGKRAAKSERLLEAGG